LSAENQFNERILTGLRTIAGVNLDELDAISVPPAAFFDKVESFIRSKWMIQEKDVISLTKEGRLRADYIASELFLE